MYSSQSLKDSFGGKEAQLNWTDKNDKKYTYHLRTKGSPRLLLITLHSIPLIDDDELREVFCNWEMVKHITHDFSQYIDSDLGRVFLHLHQGVKPEDIPGGTSHFLMDGLENSILEGKSMYVLSAVLTIHTQKATQNRCWKKASRNPTITRRRKLLHKNNNKQYKNNQTSGLKRTENILQQLIRYKNLTIQFPDVIGQPWKATLNKIQNQTTYPQRKTKQKGGRKLTLQACFQHRNWGVSSQSVHTV